MSEVHESIKLYVESFYLYHDHLRIKSLRYRVPIIILSALTTGVSFVNVSFLSKYASVLAGCMTLTVTILTGIEGYLKLPQHTNDCENTLKSLGKLSRRVYTFMASGMEVTPDLMQGIWDELGDTLETAPIIPYHTYEKFKPLIERKTIYSSFDKRLLTQAQPQPQTDLGGQWQDACEALGDNEALGDVGRMSYCPRQAAAEIS